MKITVKENDMNDMQLSYKHWVSSKNRCTLDLYACQPQTKILTQKNIIFHCCLLHAIYDVLVSDESVYL